MVSLSAFELMPSKAKSHEWLLSNGAGGYSSSTAIGMNTRKYHGLLVSPLSGVNNRHVMLSKMEETAKCSGIEYPLSTNAYPGVVYPTGFAHQVAFEFSTHPVFTYSLGGGRLQKSVRMLHGKNAVVVSYRLESGAQTELEARPMLMPRQIHADPSPVGTDIAFGSDRYGFEISKPAKMRVCSSVGKFSASPQKYYNMVYPEERDRGYLHTETLFSPGVFAATIARGEELHICASQESLSPSEALEILDRQSMRFSHLASVFSETGGFGRTDFSDSLLQASDSFVSILGKHHGICAGFPWFSEWSRDAMISLPGILVSTGRYALAREILMAHSQRMEDGLLPNFIDETGQPHYNSADASLWFLNAVREYAECTGDTAFVREKLWKCMRGIFSSYVQGNQLVSMDSDCLLAVKEPAATWMDAKVSGKAVTPRKGKPVEINALWNSNLHFIAKLAGEFGDKRTAVLASEITETLRSSFQKFVSAEEGCLLDVLEPNDASIRPNQLFAVSLPNSPLNAIQQKHIFNIVRSRLYTPLGLRTLSPQDKQYHEYYSGNQENRDSAYHQGIIWPWLLGAFYDAQLKVYPGSERAVLASLKLVFDAMKLGCAGTLPELYEPATMRPCGAVSQAWSVAEVLRIYTKVKKTLARPPAQIAKSEMRMGQM